MAVERIREEGKMGGGAGNASTGSKGASTEGDPGGSGIWGVVKELAAKVPGKEALAGLAVVVPEGVFTAWFAVATSSSERIAAGVLLLIVPILCLLLVFRALIFPVPGPRLAVGPKKLRGEWTFVSVPKQARHIPGTGWIHIKPSGKDLSIIGTLSEAGKPDRGFQAKAVWADDLELIFFYDLRDATGASQTAITVLSIPAEPHPATVQGSWYVVGSEMRGTVVYQKKRT